MIPRKNAIYIFFIIDDFTEKNFIDKLINNLKLNTTYTLLVKVSFTKTHIFKMCGPQFGLIIGEKHDKEYYKNIFLTIITRVELTLEYYDGN